MNVGKMGFFILAWGVVNRIVGPVVDITFTKIPAIKSAVFLTPSVTEIEIRLFTDVEIKLHRAFGCFDEITDHKVRYESSYREDDGQANPFAGDDTIRGMAVARHRVQLLQWWTIVTERQIHDFQKLLSVLREDLHYYNWEIDRIVHTLEPYTIYNNDLEVLYLLPKKFFKYDSAWFDKTILNVKHHFLNKDIYTNVSPIMRDISHIIITLEIWVFNYNRWFGENPDFPVYWKCSIFLIYMFNFWTHV